MNVGERIETALPGLPPQQRRAARFLLDHLADIALYDSSELAAVCGVSTATMSRLVRVIGFRDWRELRDHVRVLSQLGSPKARPLPEDAHAKHLALEIDNLRSVFDALDPEALDRAARLIKDARRVLVVGFRTSFPVALHLHGQLSQLRPLVSVAPASVRTLGEELVDLGADDVVVVVGLLRRLEGFGRMIRQLSAHQIPFVLIADQTGRKHAARALAYFEVPMDAVGGLASYTAAISLACLLENTVAALDTDAAQARHDRVGEWFEALSEIDVD
ncbi:hypothetical protein BJF90_13255 [Pseudonocardia sp. CNS-004]|nr:hypothetical protein BJF90_13255 [Pseudonocardia sp. CNS-004]